MSRIALSPWSRDAMDPAVLAALDARADALGCRVSTVKNIHPVEWVIRASGGSHRQSVELRGKGNLGAMIAGCLDDYESANA